MKDPSEISVQYLKGVGPFRKKLFYQLGVATLEDLLYLFPKRYDDRRTMTPIRALKPGDVATVQGKVISAEGRQVRSEEHTSELQSQFHLVCRLLLEKKK